MVLKSGRDVGRWQEGRASGRLPRRQASHLLRTLRGEARRKRDRCLKMVRPVLTR
jgi:hypothetical protein